MRISIEQVEIIKNQAKKVFGEGVSVRLFGSRTDDNAKGGDIDILITAQQDINEPAQLTAELSAKISRALDGRKIDVVLIAPNLKKLPIHEVAVHEGQLL